MAVEINEINQEGQAPKMVITLTDGELKALRSAQEQRKLKDMKSLFDFILAVFVTPKISFFKKGDDGKWTTVRPAENLVKEEAETHG